MADVMLFLCGDVMLGRGVDRILPRPCAPDLHEPSIRDADEYVALAERVNGPIPRPVDPAYVWGDALAEMARADARLINLETAVTRSEAWDRDKDIHYRMAPEHVGCLKAAGVDVCSLANNHVLDWGREGLAETLATLALAGIRTCGAGPDADAARAPAVIDARGGRVLVFGVGDRSSGIPASWAAGPGQPGVHLLPDVSPRAAAALADVVRGWKRPGDVAVVSIHWGPNWGYRVPEDRRAFARALVDGGVDAVWGHSSHHPLGVEVHRGRPIWWGCGDFLNDYEGIHGYEAYRGELGLMYFPRFAEGRLAALQMAATRVRRMRIERASDTETEWLRAMLAREGERFGTGARRRPDGRLELTWA